MTTDWLGRRKRQFRSRSLSMFLARAHARFEWSFTWRAGKISHRPHEPFVLWASVEVEGPPDFSVALASGSKATLRRL